MLMKKKFKSTGERFLDYQIRLNTHEGQIVINASVNFMRKNRFLSIGIQGTSETKWEIPVGYGFLVAGIDYDLARADFTHKRQLNYATIRPLDTESTLNRTAEIITPFGTVSFLVNIDYSHRRQFLEVIIDSDVPEIIELSLS